MHDLLSFWTRETWAIVLGSSWVISTLLFCTTDLLRPILKRNRIALGTFITSFVCSGFAGMVAILALFFPATHYNGTELIAVLKDFWLDTRPILVLSAYFMLMIIVGGIISTALKRRSKTSQTPKE